MEIILLILIIVAIVLIKPAKVSFKMVKDTMNKSCLTNKVNCNTDEDCKTLCREVEDMSCEILNRYTDKQRNEYGKEERVCVPKKATINCNAKYGGIKTWSGWSNPERMEWDCLCSYPNYVGGPNCNTINPGICENGTFDWDVTKGKAPSPSDCKCKKDYVLISRPDDQTPLCVPKEYVSYYKE